MKQVGAIAAEPATPKSKLLTQRKVLCVVLDPDDMDKLQDHGTISINLEETFPEYGRLSVVLVYHNDANEGISAFKQAFDLVYLDGRKT